jgi:chromosome segregation ATPase
MSSLEEKFDVLQHRIAGTEQEISNVNLKLVYHGERMESIEKAVIKHMEAEEEDRKQLESKLDNLLKYKWILFGMMIMLWLTSGDNVVLKLIGLLK